MYRIIWWGEGEIIPRAHSRITSSMLVWLEQEPLDTELEHGHRLRLGRVLVGPELGSSMLGKSLLGNYMLVGQGLGQGRVGQELGSSMSGMSLSGNCRLVGQGLGQELGSSMLGMSLSGNCKLVGQGLGQGLVARERVLGTALVGCKLVWGQLEQALVGLDMALAGYKLV